MRIGLFIDTENLGGAESVVISAVEHFIAVGHDVVVYHFGNEYLERSAAANGAESRVLPGRYWYKKTWRLPVFACRFAAILSADRIDVLHSHLFGPVFAGALACCLTRRAHIGTLHDVYIVQERPRIRGAMLTLCDLLGTRLVCVSQQMADYYASVTRIRADRLTVIRNGVVLDRYAAAERNRDADSLVHLIMVGRLDPIKRHDLLLETLGLLSGRPDWCADIVGDGPQREALEKMAADLGLAGRVKFWGLREDVPALLGAADVFLLISDSEGMSLSLIEALASGLPIIATKVGNNAELVADGENGFLIDPGDQAGLETAIRELLDAPDVRRRFSRCSRKRAQADLDVGASMSAYLNLFATAVGR